MVASHFPSLSQIRAWDTEHLRDAATTWRRTAYQWQESFCELASHMSAPGGTPWEGAASQAAQLRASSDAIKVGEIAVNVQIAATAAANGADDIDAIRRSALRAIEDAESAGFTVGEDLSVTSIHTSLTPAAEVARQAQADALAADIRAKATVLAAADHEVAAKIASAASEVRDVTFGDYSNVDSVEREPQILAAGWQPWKQGPNDSPEPPPPSPPPRTRGLPPEGLKPPVSGTLTPGPASRPSEQRVGGQSLWDVKGGEWRYFPGDDYHNPHWDYNPHNSAKWAPWQNVPIDNLPPVKSGPAAGAVPPMSPASPPAIAEPPPEPKASPPRGGPLSGVPVGGPLPDGSMPYLVDPPGPAAGGPDLPVIGDGKQDVPGP